MEFLNIKRRGCLPIKKEKKRRGCHVMTSIVDCKHSCLRDKGLAKASYLGMLSFGSCHVICPIQWTSSLLFPT